MRTAGDESVVLRGLARTATLFSAAWVDSKARAICLRVWQYQTFSTPAARWRIAVTIV
jgi:hypothetical protein